MELIFLLLVAASAFIGVLLRRVTSRRGSHVVLAVGVGMLGLGLAMLWSVMGGWSPFDSLTSGVVALLLFGVAGVALPFGAVSARLGRGRGHTR